MSALWRGAPSPVERRLLPMTPARLDAVMALENAAYEFPWTRGNFVDSIASGYLGRVLLSADDRLLGYFVAMPGVDEMHLLNITVAPAAQGRGEASFLFDALCRLCAERRADELWLEVRESNARARAIYLHLGFTQIGRRKGYYPAALGRREDAVVMSLKPAVIARRRAGADGADGTSADPAGGDAR